MKMSIERTKLIITSDFTWAWKTCRKQCAAAAVSLNNFIYPHLLRAPASSAADTANAPKPLLALARDAAAAIAFLFDSSGERREICFDVLLTRLEIALASKNPFG